MDHSSFEVMRQQRAARLLLREAEQTLAAAERRLPGRLIQPAQGGDFAVKLREAAEGALSPRTREESAEIAERRGIQPSMRDSFLIELPMTRDMTAAGVSGSSYLIGQSNPGAQFFESLVGASIATRLGVAVLPMTRDDAAIPVITTAPTTTWLDSESRQISTTQPIVGSRGATPKPCSALISFSHTLAVQSSPAVQLLLMTELGRAVAAAVDSAVFNGRGISGEPMGLLAATGISSASGASIDLADIADMLEDTVTAGAAMVSPGFATDGPTLEVLMTRARAANVGEMLTADANRLAGFPLLASKTGPASALVFCDWSTVFLATWGALELKLDAYTGFANGTISLRAIVYVDVVVAHPAAISVRTSVT